MFSAQIFQDNTFMETKSNFSLIEKCFLLINFSSNKYTHKNFKNNFLKNEFPEINMALKPDF
jgi:hypothetical protein